MRRSVLSWAWERPRWCRLVLWSTRALRSSRNVPCFPRGNMEGEAAFWVVMLSKLHQKSNRRNQCMHAWMDIIFGYRTWACWKQVLWKCQSVLILWTPKEIVTHSRPTFWYISHSDVQNSCKLLKQKLLTIYVTFSIIHKLQRTALVKKLLDVT